FEVPVGNESTTPKTNVTGTPSEVEPNGQPQDTGLTVTNKDDKTPTTVEAVDEDGNTVPVEIGADGKIKITPPANVDGPITVTVKDNDFGADKTFEVPVEGHKKGQDDNNSEKAKTDAQKNPAQDPAKIEVKDRNNLTEDEKAKVKEEVKKANPEASDVTVDDKGNATLTYPDGSKNTISGYKTVFEKGNSDYDNGSYIIPGIRYRDHKTPTHPVTVTVPEKNETGVKVHDTLWYVFRINDFQYEVVRNGVVTKRLMDVTPVLQNNRTMLPLRYVAEALQADVKWDAKTRTATFTKDGLTASIQIDSDEIVLSNGKTVKMDSKPLNINDRILVSVTNVANVFGLTNGNTKDKADQDIEWEQQDKSATIYIRR
ncbi:stalk domain-containing protein, partial [Anaerococcus lactolyticus]|uniref:stalk domain-containing protein n=1 Tax=Anaerococcus lactolyticus TaxID=33032 RepID=UPI00288A0E4E